MAYIYVITNDINGKQYVGKTCRSIEERFREHCKSKDKKSLEKRPLYNAMNKYGIEHFHISMLEECSTKESSNKEIYWIGKLDTYENGYNATFGGDGSVLYNYKELSEAYLKLGTLVKVSKQYQCATKTVSNACKEYGITVQPGGKQKNGKSICCLNKNMDIVSSFKDMTEAGKWLINNNVTNSDTKHISTNIGRVASGKRKTAYGYIWKFI